MKVYDFIKDGLESFSDNGGIYDTELKDICINLNELLNNVTDNNYEEHLEKNRDNIKNCIDNIFYILRVQNRLYINLNFLFTLLLNKNIKNVDMYGKDKYRDHYFHSIQCFLLAITLINKINMFNNLKIDVSRIFQTMIYHDIGYLYKLLNTKKINIEDGMCICNVILTRIKSLNAENIFKLFCIDSNQKINTTTTSIDNSTDIKNIWASPISDLDKSDVINITRYSYPNKDEFYKKHSYCSGILLCKFLRAKNIISDVNCNYFDNVKIYEENPNKKTFESICTAIVLHGIKLIKDDGSNDNRIFINQKPLEALLMIVDELQTYGRVPNTEDGKQLLHPKYVEFEFDSNKKLILTNSVDSKEHTTEQIVKELEKRIKEKSLETIFDIPYIKKILIHKICKILSRNI